MRAVSGLGSLRKRDMYLAIREATVTVALRDGFRIVYLSIQANHIHMIVEATGKTVLARGMQSFAISAAKHINRTLTIRTGERRRGAVFADRYHARALTSPRAVRNAIAYVLNNWRRHQEDRAAFAENWKVDPYSNGADFFWWKEREDSPWLYQTPKTYLGMFMWLPKTWLLKVGWLKHGLISVHDVPGPEPKARSRARPTPS